MKKTAKVFGSNDGFKPILPRKKRRDGVLEDSSGGKVVGSKIQNSRSWNSKTGDTTKSDSIDMEEECLVKEISFRQKSGEESGSIDTDMMLKDPKRIVTKYFWNWFLNEHSAETYTAYTTYYFDQAYFENNFEERNNSINQLLYSATFKQQPPDFEYLNHQIHIWIAAHQATETPFETEEESYQTVSVFDLLSSESDLSTQTVTPELMANDPMQANILATFQGIQTALGRRNNTPIPLFRGDVQNLIEWLDDFERAATANQYDDKYKFQIVGGYLQGSPVTWFSQETDANAQQRIFRTPILISKWHIELERRTQGPSEVVTKYAKAIRKLIKRVDTGRNWTEEQKIHSFTKGLRTDLSYALWPLLALKDNPTMNMAIELAQRIEDNQRIHLGSTLPVFAPVPVMAPVPQMTATSFATHTQDPNKQLIDRLTANLARLLEPLAQAVRENQQPQRPRFEPCFNQPQQPSYQRQQNRGPPVCYHSFKLVGAPPKGESASQPEENPFYAFNLTDDDHDIDELAINPSESTRKKKKAKVDFVLDLNKASTSTADNNEPPKAKVFKNPPKLEPPEIVQKSSPYSAVKDFMETPAHITFGQLMTHPQFRKDLCKSLIPKKKTPKTNKCPHQAGLADNSNVTSLICKAQVAGYFIDLILDSGSSVSVIAKHFLEAIGRKIDEPST
ncbi:hypothetical protein G9A89_019685 [Geosiphon pyriformis]|nr:hypothetical protein G9A89_019685 [Geosiphon pyriformis]